jgi:CRP/FNR family transcriptional regulator
MTGDICDLSSCFLCTHCVSEWKGAVASAKQTRHYKKGQSIFREGEEVTGIYFIYSGAVKVHQAWGNDKELILRFATSGSIVGYRGHGGGTTFPISATALEPTTVCFVTSAFLEASLKTNPGFLYTMMQLYAGELQKAEKRMRNLAMMEVKGRIADALLTIQETFRVDAEGYIKVPVTRHDIAAYAGTTYETVFKLFTEWSGSGLMETSGKSIRINDSHQLRGFIQH